jgi:uncharacterized spore protein YtfJ
LAQLAGEEELMNGVTVPDELKQSIDGKAAGAAGGLVEKIAERFGGAAAVGAVYGTPVERDGTTIIPVARVAWGFGAGSGSGGGPDGSGGGEGGGGGANATPIGFVEIRDGRAEFRPIHVEPPLWAVASLVVAAGFTSWVVLRGLRRLLRG